MTAVPSSMRSVAWPTRASTVMASVPLSWLIHHPSNPSASAVRACSMSPSMGVPNRIWPDALMVMRMGPLCAARSGSAPLPSVPPTLPSDPPPAPPATPDPFWDHPASRAPSGVYPERRILRSGTTSASPVPRACTQNERRPKPPGVARPIRSGTTAASRAPRACTQNERCGWGRTVRSVEPVEGRGGRWWRRVPANAGPFTTAAAGDGGCASAASTSGSRPSSQAQMRRRPERGAVVGDGAGERPRRPPGDCERASMSLGGSRVPACVLEAQVHAGARAEQHHPGCTAAAGRRAPTRPGSAGEVRRALLVEAPAWPGAMPWWKKSVRVTSRGAASRYSVT